MWITLLLGVGGWVVRVWAGGSVLPTQDTDTNTSPNTSPSLITTLQTEANEFLLPPTWTRASNSIQLLETTRACTLLTSPAVGGVYQGTTSLAIRWFHDSTSIDQFTAQFSTSVTMTLTLSWVDNHSNMTGTIGTSILPTSGLYLWDMPPLLSSQFNKRLYIVLQPQWEGLDPDQSMAASADQLVFETQNGLQCQNHLQIAGPFTLLPQPTPLFFVTGPDPGTRPVGGHGPGLLYPLPMGLLFLDMVISPSLLFLFNSRKMTFSDL
ncbi:hypothetical protein BDF14DRAFT_176277 [Spinellus fusiger]|nr:hypothetical protein BDF14DRAFT_176277 [Spinellus fusiger]